VGPPVLPPCRFSESPSVSSEVRSREAAELF
jgi:hypothetical protein